jgi:PPOX class probable F420-dependent enzyme
MGDDDALLGILAVPGRTGVLTTLRRDGRPQMSVVSHHLDRQARVLRVSVTDTRAKTRNLRRDPRAGYLVLGPTPWQYAVAEADAELSPVATAPDDPAADELVDLYRALAGEHPDWEEFRAAMVQERRLVLRLHLTRLYGSA